VYGENGLAIADMQEMFSETVLGNIILDPTYLDKLKKQLPDLAAEIEASFDIEVIRQSIEDTRKNH
jgi:hypothetical protein